MASRPSGGANQAAAGAQRPNGAPQNKICQFKLVLLGESAVGKSSLVLRFVKGQFHEYQESTIGGQLKTLMKGDDGWMDVNLGIFVYFLSLMVYDVKVDFVLIFCNLFFVIFSCIPNSNCNARRYDS